MATPSVSYLDSKARIRISDLIEAKRRGEKWPMLTTYDATSARIFDLAKIPCLLIGDSAAQMVYGYRSTVPITMDELIPLARAVSTSCKRALVVADLPFGSYQESPEQALRSATRFMKESQVHAIKLEGGQEFSEHVRLLTRSGIPVMGHVGFTPQSEHALSGFKVQGRTSDSANKILADAKAVEDAGAFACVVELAPEGVGLKVSEALKIPVVGIGAGPSCDAQVMVWHDMVGFTAPNSVAYLTPESSDTNANETTTNEEPEHNVSHLKLDRVPKFVKRYANLSDQIYNAAVAFAKDVQSGTYPSKEHCYE